MPRGIGSWRPPAGPQVTSASIVLHAWQREPLRATIRDDVRYTETFDRLEVLLALVAIDVRTEAATAGEYTHDPAPGSFTWRYKNDPTPPEQRLKAEFDATGPTWPPLSGGILAGSDDRARVAFDALINGNTEVHDNQH